jgi:hypothetical protein
MLFIKKRSLRSFFSQLKPPSARGLAIYFVHAIVKIPSHDVVCAYSPSTHCQSTTYFFSLRALFFARQSPAPTYSLIIKLSAKYTVEECHVK